MNNDEHQEDYKLAYAGVVGSDRMAIGLPVIPDKLKGDMDEVERLRSVLKRLIQICEDCLNEC